MKITILAVGKIKEPFYRQAIAEFEKRLGKYIKLTIIEIQDEKTPENASAQEQKIILDKEGARLMKQIPANAYVIALAIQGRQLDSMQLSEMVQSLGVGGTSHIVFLIGGSLGLADTVLKNADLQLSFSKMTFPHQLMRIIHHEPYHK